MVPCLLGAHLAGDGEAVVLAVLVVALDVKVGEVDRDAPLWRSQDLPHTILSEVRRRKSIKLSWTRTIHWINGSCANLVSRIQLWERR